MSALFIGRGDCRLGRTRTDVDGIEDILDQRLGAVARLVAGRSNQGRGA